MKIIFLVPLLATLASSSSNPGILNGAHFIPSTNIVSSRTIIGTAVGGGPTSGAVSTSQYSQTVPAPSTVQTVITSHPVPAPGYVNAPGNAASGGSSPHSTGGSSAGSYSSYTYTNVPQVHTGGNAQAGYNNNPGGSPAAGYSQPQPSYYNQRYY